MRNDIFTYLAIFAALIGLTFSIITFIKKIKAQRKLIKLINEKKSDLEKLKKLETLRNNLAHSKVLVSIDEFNDIKYSFKILTDQLDKSERKEILEPLEQKSTKGQLDYVNRILHLSGSTENIIIKDQ